MANRKQKRAAKAQARKAGVNKQVVKPAKDKPEIVYNAKGDKLKAAIASGVDRETSTEANAMVDQAVAVWRAINAKQMDTSTDHVRRYLNDVRDAVIAVREADVGRRFAVEPAAVIPSRVSDALAWITLHNWKCREPLAKNLRALSGLSTSALTNIGRWLAKEWSADKSAAPSLVLLRKAARKGKSVMGAGNRGNRTRGGKRRGAGSATPGMPLKSATDGLGFVIKCLTAFNSKHRALLGKNEQRVVGQAMTGLKGLFTPLRAAVKAKAQDEAEAIAKKVKAQKGKGK